MVQRITVVMLDATLMHFLSPFSMKCISFPGVFLHLFFSTASSLFNLDCKASKLNRENAMDHSRWRKLIKDS